MTRAPALRATALLALGAFAVHQLRYALVPDAHAAAGHAYLAAAPPLLTLLLAAALGRTLVGVAHGETGGGPRPTWLTAGAALLALHVGQEAAERLAAGGGPVDRGALLVVPLCLVAGWLIAWALRRTQTLAADVLPALPRPRLLPVGSLVPHAARSLVPARTGVARHLAGRAPPAGC